MSNVAMIADELKTRSWTLRETVRVRFDQKLVNELFTDQYFAGFSLEPDATYCWGSLAYNDPDILWMIRLELPGEA